jgi:hypothetical protein
MGTFSDKGMVGVKVATLEEMKQKLRKLLDEKTLLMQANPGYLALVAQVQDKLGRIRQIVEQAKGDDELPYICEWTQIIEIIDEKEE